MPKFYLFLLTIISFLSLNIKSATAQNVYISMQADNSGKVVVGNSFFLRIVIGNGSSTVTLPVYRIRPLFLLPNYLSLAVDGHVLPQGWSILSTDGATFRLSNGTGTIPPNTQREILMRVNGNTLGGPSLLTGNMQFANGTAPGNTPGPPTSGNINADDIGSVSIEVVNSLPVTLVDFNAALVNCNALLKWKTKTEINSDRFEVERTTQNNGHWSSIGKVTAAGNSYSDKNYSFVDNNLGTDASSIFYRLKTIDKDGSFRYSNTIMLVNTCRFTQVLTYPNPVLNGKLYVNVSQINNPHGSLISVTGQVLKHQKLNNGLNTINTQSLPAGIYELIISNESGIVQRVKILVQK